MKKRGLASTPAELKNWPNDKLVTELFKQARVDFGGSKDPVALIVKKWRKYSASCDVSTDTEEMVAKFALELVKKQISSVRNRQQSKREEIKRRLKNNGTTM